MSAPDWLADAVFYQIFPERFANGNPALNPENVEPWDATPTRENFLGGDLAGIVQHLDHIVDLGATALYLTPIFEARTNHRYDAIDYFAIDHRLGTLDDFRALLAACHSRGVKVVLDAVLNHCGDGHPAFRDVVEREAESDYVNWFFTEEFPVSAEPEPNYRTCSGCYYLPKWNTYNPEVRAHHLRVARYWVEQGIDGWRLDVPYFVPTSFWRQFRQTVKALGEDLYIVAEEWRQPEQWLQGDTADGTMNYTLRDLVLGFTADRTLTGQQFADGMNTLTARIPYGYHHGMLNLLGSHDTERVLTRHGGDVQATLLAFGMMFASQGAPMVYYGDDVGMTGDIDPGCRAGMIWDMSQWAAGMYDGIRTWAQLRRATPALRRGLQSVYALSEDTVVIERTLDGDRVAVVAHRGDGVTLDPATHAALAAVLSTPTAVGANGTLVLGPTR